MILYMYICTKNILIRGQWETPQEPEINAIKCDQL